MKRYLPSRLAWILGSGLWLWIAGNPSADAQYFPTILGDGPTGYWRLGEPGGSTTAFNFGTAGPSANGT